MSVLIKVLSRSAAGLYECIDMPWACISIATEENTWPDIDEEMRQGLLQLHFADASDPKWCHLAEQRGLAPFEDTHAKKIWDFVEGMWPHIDLLLVHCEAGVSRSAAVAGAISKAQTGDDMAFFESPYVPNMRVYNYTLTEANERGYFKST